jgi:hypothetical protein
VAAAAVAAAAAAEAVAGVCRDTHAAATGSKLMLTCSHRLMRQCTLLHGSRASHAAQASRGARACVLRSGKQAA